MVDRPFSFMTITSTHNPRIRSLRRLRTRKHRQEEGLFMAEGEDLLEAALAHGAPPRTVPLACGTAAPSCVTSKLEVPLKARTRAM